MKNKVFLSEDMKRLYYVRSDHEIHTFSLERGGVILHVIGNAIHASAVTNTDLEYYESTTQPRVALKATNLLTMSFTEKNGVPNGQAQVIYIEKARTLDFIGIGDIMISFNGNGSERAMRMGEAFKIEMAKVQKGEDGLGRFISKLMVRIYLDNNKLKVDKIG